ncbi:MAG: helix-turn-helix transcriptional regulator [Alphaproteobacteria bacterium]
MITGRQIRAARALLDMSQEELAAEAGLTAQGIRKIEDGTVQPRVGTITDITQVFAEHGVEFTDHDGVKMRDDAITMIEGDNVYVRLLDDVIHTLAGQEKAEALFACVVDSVSPEPVIENYRRLRRSGIKMRSLIREGDTAYYGHAKEYRCLPSRYFHNAAIVIYGDKLATMILNTEGGDDSALVIRNRHVVTAQKNLFDFMWSTCPLPPPSTAEINYD